MSTTLPAPPAVLFGLESGDVRTIEVGESIGRIYFQTGEFPTSWDAFRHFGPVARFDHHAQGGAPALDSNRAISYWAVTANGVDALTVSLGEVFQRLRVVDVSRSNPAFVITKPVLPLTLVDLTSLWVARNGGNQAISSGPHGPSQQWSAAIHSQFPDVDGVLYASSVASPGVSIALYERAAAALGRPAFHRRLDDQFLAPLIDARAQRLGYGLN